MAQRIIRTKAERFADNQKEQAKLKQSAIDSAIRLRAQAEAWVARSEELKVKAVGANDKANAELESFGIDAEEFWTEHFEKVDE